MATPLKFVGIAGSLRTASYSRTVLKSIAELLPAQAHFSTVDIGQLPHYNEDLDVTEAPDAVAIARSQVAASDAIIVVTPEFNHGLPGVLKNTLDWLSRPAFDSCFIGKPVFFVTLSPGALGGVRAQYQLRETLSSMLCQLVPMPEVAITYVADKAPGGRLSDVTTLRYLTARIEQFVGSISRQ
jgi:chromate reductase